MQHEDNKLIMEFMGLKVDSKNFVKIPAHGYIHRGNYQEEFNTSSVRYHKSWDWLMPCIRKIYLDYEGLPSDWFFDISIASPIELVYNAVVEFLKSEIG